MTSPESEISFICSSVTGLIRNATSARPSLHLRHRLGRPPAHSGYSPPARSTHARAPADRSSTTLCSCTTSSFALRRRDLRMAHRQRLRRTASARASSRYVPSRKSPPETPSPASASAAPVSGLADPRDREELLRRLRTNVLRRANPSRPNTTRCVGRIVIPGASMFTNVIIIAASGKSRRQACTMHGSHPRRFDGDSPSSASLVLGRRGRNPQLRRPLMHIRH